MKIIYIKFLFVFILIIIIGIGIVIRKNNDSINDKPSGSTLVFYEEVIDDELRIIFTD